MTKSRALAGACGWTRREAAGAVALRANHWLGLAAAPTFAVMAFLAALPGAGPAETLCPAARGAPLPGGMATMYVLMAVFHLTPWLRLIESATRRTESRPRPVPRTPPFMGYPDPVAPEQRSDHRRVDDRDRDTSRRPPRATLGAASL